MDEEQQNAAAAAAAAVTFAARKTRRLKMISILTREEELPFQTRNEMDELIKEFLEKIETNIHNMLCDNYVEADDYRGLDSDRDTEDEVETAIRFFPGVLSKGINDSGPFPIGQISYTHDGSDLYGFNSKAVSFIHLLAGLAIELGSFEVKYRGGLLCGDFLRCSENILVELVRRSTSESQNQEPREVFDDKCLHVLIQLRKLGLFKKEDIQSCSLLHMGCFCHNSDYIAENTFRFLIEWDPNSLLDSGHRYWNGRLPLHVAVESSCFQGFQLVFDAGIRFFPKKGISLLFKIDYNCDTPFQMACKKFGSGVVMAGVEETLTRYNSCSDNTSPLDIMEAFKSAVIDDSVHIDCLYFLMQREPCVLQKLLSLKPEAMLESGMDSTNSIIGNKNSNSSSDDENDKTGKRKRKENTEQNDKN